MKRIARQLAILLAAAVFSCEGQENKTVAPIGFDSVPGNVPDAIFGGGELQQMFRGSSLSPVFPSPIRITGVSFRVDESNVDFQSTLGRVEIRLSSTTRNPETMSRFWEVNKGADATTVFLHENVAVNAVGTTPLNPFQVTFRFDQSFAYDPRAGSLLMFIRTDGPAGGASIDAHDFESVGSLGTSPVGMVHLRDPVVSARGVITEFSWIAVPEPNIGSLFLGGLLVAKLISTKRNTLVGNN